MKVDAYLSSAGPGEVGEFAGRAARLGYDGLMVPEIGHDPFLVAAVAASAAPDLTIGTAVAIAFARSPMTVAYSSRDLSVMTGGRFILGLGTQVRAHVVHRFSMPWSAPTARLTEYVSALRTIWRTWQTGEPLRFRGEYYRFSLMTPMFSPGPLGVDTIPVAIAGVGPGLSRVAGEVADGFHVHPFHTVPYLREVVLTEIDGGIADAGRSPGSVTRIGAVMVATGETDAEVARGRDSLRTQIAFYASTPSYRRVLDHGGWDIGDRLTAMSKRGEWEAMADVVPDDLVDAVAVSAPLDRLAAALRARYDGVLDRIGFYPAIPLDLPDDVEAELVADLRA